MVNAAKCYEPFHQHLLPRALNAALPHLCLYGRQATVNAPKRQIMSLEGVISHILYQIRQIYSKLLLQPLSKSTQVCAHFNFLQSFSNPVWCFCSALSGWKMECVPTLTSQQSCLLFGSTYLFIRESLVFIIGCHGSL